MSTSMQRASDGKSQVNKAAASGWMGSALEYYDFFVYGTAAALFFPQLFFPQDDPVVAIITSLATYAVGFVARPFGALFLGHWGDRYGRKSVLVFSMILMGVSTTCVGLLPTYEQIGVWAPATLIVLRLIQGFALGGEQPGANSMILEHAPLGRRGFYGSFVAQGTQAGQILAAGVFIPLLHFMPEPMFYSIGWRIPFLLSVAIVILGIFVRRKVDETPEFKRQMQSGRMAKAPVLETFRFAWPDMLRVTGMALAYVVPATITVFGAAYAAQPAYGIGFSKELFLWIPVLGNIIAVITIPFVGSLSDKIGRRPTFIAGMLLSGLATVLYLYAISIHSVALMFTVAMIAWGILYQGYNAIVPSFWPEHNIGVVLGSFIPILLVAVAPPGSSNIPLKVGAIAFAVACLAAFAAWSARETYRIRMEDLGDKHAVPVDADEYERMRKAASRKEGA